MKKPLPKKSNQNKKHTDTEMKRYVGAIIEKVKDGFKAQSEHTMGIIQKLDKIEKTLNSHTQMIGSVMVDVSALKDEVSEIKEKLELHDKKLASV